MVHISNAERVFDGADGKGGTMTLFRMVVTQDGQQLGAYVHRYRDMQTALNRERDRFTKQDSAGWAATWTTYESPNANMLSFLRNGTCVFRVHTTFATKGPLCEVSISSLPNSRMLINIFLETQKANQILAKLGIWPFVPDVPINQRGITHEELMDEDEAQQRESTEDQAVVDDCFIVHRTFHPVFGGHSSDEQWELSRQHVPDEPDMIVLEITNQSSLLTSVTMRHRMDEHVARNLYEGLGTILGIHEGKTPRQQTLIDLLKELHDMVLNRPSRDVQAKLESLISALQAAPPPDRQPFVATTDPPPVPQESGETYSYGSHAPFPPPR